VLPTLPFFALALGLCAVTAWLEKNHVGAQGPDFALTFPQRCLVAGHAFWFYLGKLFWPANLCFVYPRWQPNPGSGWQWLQSATAIGALFALWLARGRLGRGPVTALFFFVGTLFPVLGFMNAYGMRYSFVWDHWVYLSALGIIALAAALVVQAAESIRKPAVVYGFAAIVLPVLALLTWRQAGTYTDTETLWRDTLAKNPDCWMVHTDLGLLLKKQGRIEEAMEHYHKAIQINPNFFEALFNLGIILADKGRLDEAIENYRKAIQINPDFSVAFVELGNALAAQGKFDEAIENYYKAIQINPDFSEALNNLGIALAAQGRFDEAIENFRKAIQINPNFTEGLDNLGVALAAKGRFDEAIENYRKAIQVNSNRSETFFHLGTTLGQLGRNREAVAQYREALRLNPNLTGALNNLAWVLAANPDARLRNGAEAVRLAERACELTHDGEPLFIGTLAAAYAEAGRFPEAVTTAEKAAQLATSAGLKKVAEKNQQLLELYRAGKAYHEPVPTGH
jgi:tetratricopeptide (TPR) repeat protein